MDENYDSDLDTSFDEPDDVSCDFSDSGDGGLDSVSAWMDDAPVIEDIPSETDDLSAETDALETEDISAMMDDAPLEDIETLETDDAPLENIETLETDDAPLEDIETVVSDDTSGPDVLLADLTEGGALDTEDADLLPGQEEFLNEIVEQEQDTQTLPEELHETPET